MFMIFITFMTIQSDKGSYDQPVAYPGIQMRTEDRDLGAVAPYSGVLEAVVISYKKFRFI